ncbi:MAG TPA: SAM-dependent methyltransferase [Chitinophagaceae bacterium]|nr:SAM-dependent methyltransferase [Chitinophagaceae bacterium]
MGAAHLYLIPCPLSIESLFTIPDYVRVKILGIDLFFVENERTARRFLRALDSGIPIGKLQFFPMNHHAPPDIRAAKDFLTGGRDIGLISEAGCPGVADPGSVLVETAHHLAIPVVPLVGPSAILLALMASGMNGQQFRFAGYLPVKPLLRKKKILELEQRSRKCQETQIFIETPYRNRQLLTDLLSCCSPSTRLCIAADLTGPGEFIRSMTIAKWKEGVPELHKTPAIFLICVP